MASRLEDYALIGDCQTAALVARDGSMDWLCFPRFDSGACFAALLGTPEHGRWLLAPRATVRTIQRRYRAGTLVLETDYETDEGAVTVIDCMRSREPDLVRTVVGRRGQVPMHMDLAIRFDYGSIIPWVRRVEQGMQAVAGPDTLRLHTDVALRGADFTTVADFTVTPGQRVPFVLSWHPSQEPAPPPIDPEDTIRHTERWWREWSDRCTYEGPAGGGITLAHHAESADLCPHGRHRGCPDDLLPEQLGGVRNWDYRYCWVRDATFTLYALMMGGYTEEARLARVAAACRRGSRRSSTSCTGWPGNGGCRNWPWNGCRATRARRRCGSATRPTGSSSWMCLAKSWMRCTWRGRWDWNPMRMPGGWSAPCSITWRGPGKSR